jgi:hypothetical protein
MEIKAWLRDKDPIRMLSVPNNNAFHTYFTIGAEHLKVYWGRRTLREERRLWVFENRVLRGVFGAKRDEVTGEWRKLHNEELNDLHSLPNIVLVVKSRRI